MTEKLPAPPHPLFQRKILELGQTPIANMLVATRKRRSMQERQVQSGTGQLSK